MKAKLLNFGLQLISNPLILGLGIVIGLVIGLIIGWGIWPVSYTELAPVDLSANPQLGYQQNYLMLLAEHYDTDPDTNLKAMLGQRWEPADAAKLVDSMVKDPKWAAQKPQLEALAKGLRAVPVEKPPSGLPTWVPICLAGLLVLAVLAAGGWIAWRRWLGVSAPPPSEPGVITPVQRARESRPVEPTVWTGVAEKPISQFVTTYEIGDNRYDMSFSIESGPDFLGECGVAISETIGVGDPDKVTALEAWLFDKNDIRTVTKVLMSRHCFGDATLRAKLAAKGEAVLIEPDASVELDTQTLRLRVRVIELHYGSDGLPPDSFFDKVTLELAAWPKTLP